MTIDNKSYGTHTNTNCGENKYYGGIGRVHTLKRKDYDVLGFTPRRNN